MLGSGDSRQKMEDTSECASHKRQLSVTILHITEFQHLSYLQHYHTDLFDTVYDGLRNTGNSDCTFCGVRQHIPCNLDLCPCTLENKQDFWGQKVKYKYNTKLS